MSSLTFPFLSKQWCELAFFITLLFESKDFTVAGTVPIQTGFPLYKSQNAIVSQI